MRKTDEKKVSPPISPPSRVKTNEKRPDIFNGVGPYTLYNGGERGIRTLDGVIDPILA